jgi:hypothetical protein
MHSRRTPLIDKCAAHAAVAETGRTTTVHPVLKARNSASVISPEAGELAMVATRNIPSDLHVIGLIGQDKTVGRVALQ